MACMCICMSGSHSERPTGGKKHELKRCTRCCRGLKIENKKTPMKQVSDSAAILSFISTGPYTFCVRHLGQTQGCFKLGFHVRHGSAMKAAHVSRDKADSQGWRKASV